MYDVAASSGGAASILYNFYKKCVEDKENQYVFVVSSIELSECDNVRVIAYPWIKKSMVHRYFFELFCAAQLVKKINPDKIFSLQNTTILFCDPNIQTIYMHQSLPFSSIKFSLFDQPKLWFKQNILGCIIRKSIRKCEKVIVQTNWIKEACAELCKVPRDHFIVEDPPKIEVLTMYENPSNPYLFYPANGNKYKNHEVLIKALTSFKREHSFCPHTVFTISQEMGNYAKSIIDLSKQNQLDIEFVGEISRKRVWELYKRSILVFPSYLETLGLPLLEARYANAPILASDMPFSREVLNGYGNASFFSYDDSEALKKLIEVQYLED